MMVPRIRLHQKTTVTTNQIFRRRQSSKMSGKTFQVVCVVLGYWTISISMVFANKYLVGDRNSKFDVSLFVAWVQCIFTVLFILLIQLGKRTLSHWQHVEWEPVWKSTSVTHMHIIKKILPMTCTYVGMLTFNNLCLKHVGVAFFQVARSMTLIFTVILSVLILKKKISLKIFGCCMAVASGFVLGIDQEKLAGTLSISGVLYGVITSLFVAMNGIFTKRCLEVVDRNSVRLTLYNNINASVLFLPFVIGSGQFTAMYQSDHFSDVFFWSFLAASGILSFAIAWISAKQIDLTSPVTHHISANSKAVLQTLIAVVYYQEIKQPLWWFSIGLVVSGATGYAVTRIQEEKATKLENQLEPIEEVSGDTEKLIANGMAKTAGNPSLKA